MIARFVVKIIFEVMLMLFFIRTARINFYPEQYYSDLDIEYMKAFRRLLGKSTNIPPLHKHRFTGFIMILVAGFIGLLVLLDLFLLLRYLMTGHF